MSIIAISRGTFSGGEAVARGVAERLGYRCLSREALLETARGYGVPAGDLAATMERRPPLWARMLGRRSCHLALMRAAICTHAAAGDLVYHGHLGHLFLPGVSHVLAVRVIADMEYRVTAAMQQQRLAAREARAYIDKVDRERCQWTRFLFGVDWNDPGAYDLVLNVSRMSVDSACECVVQLAARPEFWPTAASSRAVQDLARQSRAEAALLTDARTRGLDPIVAVEDGVIIISGTTQSPGVIAAVPAVLTGLNGKGVGAFQSHVRLLREGTPAAR